MFGIQKKKVNSNILGCLFFFFFSGLRELNGSCSQLIIELLKNLMLNQNVMLSIKGLMKNVHIVSVEKCSENGTINVGDKLVTYGLAKNVTPKKQAALSKGISSRFIADLRVVDLTLPLPCPHAICLPSCLSNSVAAFILILPQRKQLDNANF